MTLIHKALGRAKPRTWRDSQGRYCMMVASACTSICITDEATNTDSRVTCPECLSGMKKPARVIRLYVAVAGKLVRAEVEREQA